MDAEDRGLELKGDGRATRILSPRYMRCRLGHRDVWYDATTDERCPLCAALRINALQQAGA